jgi:aminopeptidase N
LFKLLILLFLIIISGVHLISQQKMHHSQILNNIPSHPLGYIPQPFDVLSYDADIDLTAAPAMDMIGVCKVRALITGQKDTSDFIFHLRGLKVDSVLYYSTKVNVTEVGIPDSATYHYKFSLSTNGIPNEKIKSLDTAEIVIYYSGVMTPEISNGIEQWGGVRSSNGVLYSMGVGFHNNYVSTTQHWLPCYDHPSDKATFTGRFKVRSNLVCASVGLLKEVRKIDALTNIYTWKHDYPCATYLFTFVVGDYKLISYENNGLPYYLYTLAKDSVNTVNNFKLLPNMVKAFEKRFGKYPFDKVGYANTPTGSMESQTLINYDWQLLRQKDTVNATAAHELAHQWFGDLVSCFDYRDAWLSEGFAKYCEAIWTEELFGKQKYIDELTFNINSYFVTFASQEGVFSLYDYPRTGKSSNYPLTIYFKGAAVLAMLRYRLGDGNFFNGISNYIKKYGYRNTTTELLKSELETSSGTDLDSFFNQWVYGKGWPVLKIFINCYYKGNDTVDAIIDITQTQKEEYGIYGNLPVEVGFILPNGKSHYEIVILDGKEQSFELKNIPYFTAVNVNKGPNVRSLLQVNGLNFSITDVKEESDRSLIKIYPNPVSDNLIVETINFPGDARYRITDILGNNLFNGVLKPGSTSLEINSDELNLPDGIYYLTADYGRYTKTYTFIIIK